MSISVAYATEVSAYLRDSSSCCVSVCTFVPVKQVLFCTSKASTFVLVKLAPALFFRCARSTSRPLCTPPLFPTALWSHLTGRHPS